MNTRERMMADLEHAGYAESTQSSYLSSIGDFAKFHWQAPEDMGRDEVRSWVEFLTKRCSLSQARIKQHYAALRFFCGKTLGKPDEVSFLACRSEPGPLPETLSIDVPTLTTHLLPTSRRPCSREAGPAPGGPLALGTPIDPEAGKRHAGRRGNRLQTNRRAAATATNSQTTSISWPLTDRH